MKATIEDGNDQPRELSCRLTSVELRHRKATIIASLKRRVLQKTELKNGYAYCFPGADSTLDELIEFIKTERACCDFFTFNLSINGDKKETWLKITGKDDAKEFLTSELGL